MSETAPRKYLDWRLHILMAERRIRRVTDLHRMLQEVGVEISTTQLSRIVSQRPKRINTEVLDGLVTVLNCSIEDLLVAHDPEEENEKPTPKKTPRKGATSRVTGPAPFSDPETR